MASIIIIAGIAFAAYHINKNYSNAYEAYKKIEEEEASKLPGFNFSRIPKNDLFSNFGDIITQPGMPTGENPESPFIEVKEFNGIYGIPKLLCKTQNNTLYTIYKGTENKINI